MADLKVSKHVQSGHIVGRWGGYIVRYTARMIQPPMGVYHAATVQFFLRIDGTPGRIELPERIVTNGGISVMI